MCCRLKIHVPAQIKHTGLDGVRIVQFRHVQAVFILDAAAFVTDGNDAGPNLLQANSRMSTDVAKALDGDTCATNLTIAVAPGQLSDRRRAIAGSLPPYPGCRQVPVASR